VNEPVGVEELAERFEVGRNLWTNRRLEGEDLGGWVEAALESEKAEADAVDPAPFHAPNQGANQPKTA
jgi:hypothetical protein